MEPDASDRQFQRIDLRRHVMLGVLLHLTKMACAVTEGIRDALGLARRVVACGVAAVVVIHRLSSASTARRGASRRRQPLEAIGWVFPGRTVPACVPIP